MTETTLARPLFVRAYLGKTPARIMNEAGQECPWSNRRILKFNAQLEGAHSARTLFEMPLGEKTFDSLRSKTITSLSGNDITSVVPTEPFEFNGGQNVAISPFTSGVVTAMKPGKNVVTFQLLVGCDANPAADGREFHVASEGKITFNLQSGDLTAFARRVGPRLRPSLDRAAETRIKPLFTKQLVKGARLLSFAADRTEVKALVEKSTDLRAILRNADNTCSYVKARWVEPYSNGVYENGSSQGAYQPELLPCP